MVYWHLRSRAESCRTSGACNEDSRGRTCKSDRREVCSNCLFGLKLPRVIIIECYFALLAVYYKQWAI